MSSTEMTLADGKVLVTCDGPVARLVFNKPERMNAMSFDMWDALRAALSALEADDDIRVVVLSGAGGRAFVSGADISEFDTMRGTREAVQAYNAVSEAADAALANFPKPTICQIQGYCVGGGMGLAVACDLRICSAESRLGITAGKLGLGYGRDGVRKLVELAGPSVAARVLYSAELFSAQKALAMGLVTEVVAREDLEAQVTALAERIAGNAPLTLRAAKAAIRSLSDAPGVPSEQAVTDLVRACFDSEDYAEGRKAFAEKRRPVFRGH